MQLHILTNISQFNVTYQIHHRAVKVWHSRPRIFLMHSFIIFCIIHSQIAICHQLWLTQFMGDEAVPGLHPGHGQVSLLSNLVHVQHTDYIEAWSLSLGRAPCCRTTTSLLLAVGSRHQEQNLAHALANSVFKYQTEFGLLLKAS